MSFRVLVGGVVTAAFSEAAVGTDRTSYFRAQSCEIDLSLNRRGVMSIEMNDPAASWRPELFDEIYVEDWDRDIGLVLQYISGSTTLTASSATFVVGDINKYIIIDGGLLGNPTNYPLQTQIVGFTSSTSVTIANAPTVSSSSRRGTILNSRRFGGVVSEVDEGDIIDTRGRRCFVNAVDFSQIASRRVIMQDWNASSITMKAVLDVLIGNAVPGTGIGTMASSVLQRWGVTLRSTATGPTLTNWSAEAGMTFTEVLDRVALYTSRVWYIDAFKRLVMEAPSSGTGPTALTATGIVVQRCLVRKTAKEYASAARARFGTPDKSGFRTHVFTPLLDGAARSWDIPYALYAPPPYCNKTDASLSLTNVYSPIGRYGNSEDAALEFWYEPPVADPLLPTPGRLRQNASFPLLSAGGGDALTITLPVQYPCVTPARSASSPDLSLVERLIDLPATLTVEDANIAIDAYLATRKTIPQRVEITTLFDGFEPNQNTTVTFPTFGLSGNYFVTRVRARYLGVQNQRWMYELELLSGTQFQKDWADFFERGIIGA